MLAVAAAASSIFAFAKWKEHQRNVYSESHARANCRANLRGIDHCKATWAVERRKSADETPQSSDLFGPTLYMKSLPICSAGGSYSINAINEKPTCTIPGHTL